MLAPEPLDISLKNGIDILKPKGWELCLVAD
jgi:hypothetical protein